MQKESKVSIITPVFNRADLIAETINSLLAQSYVYWEMIIIDDGSTDNTCDVVEQYSKNENRINYIKRKTSSKGPSACRNIGLKIATGDYIIFLDSDDLLEINCLKNRVEFMDKNPQIDFAVFQVETFGADSKKKTTVYSANYLSDFLANQWKWHLTGPIWKRKSILELEGFDESFFNLEDPEIHTRALLKGLSYKVFYNSEVDSHYRKYPNQKTNLTPLLNGYKKHIEKFYKLIENREDFENCCKSLKISRKSALNSFFRWFKAKDSLYCKSQTQIISSINSLCYKLGLINMSNKIFTDLLLYFFRMSFSISKNHRYVYRKIISKLF